MQLITAPVTNKNQLAASPRPYVLPQPAMPCSTPPEHAAGPVTGGPAAECLLLLPADDAPHTTPAALHPVVTRMLLCMDTQPV
jgi:hypothetical protein